MKGKLIITLAFVCLAFTSQTNAYYYKDSTVVTYNQQPTYAYQEEVTTYQSSYQSSCESGRCQQGPNHCSSCECADKGYAWNNCISKGEFCEAFGNIGGR